MYILNSTYSISLYADYDYLQRLVKTLNYWKNRTVAVRYT